jgi:hypothetical protein
MNNNDLNLRRLYFGHDPAELALLQGALESADIPFILKREFGLQSHAPAVFFSPGTETGVYVSEEDWDRSVDLACTVLGEGWEPPAEE